MKKDSSNFVNLFMIINFSSYEELKSFVPPEIEMLKYIVKFDHKVTCLLSSNNIEKDKKFLSDGSNVHVLACNPKKSNLRASNIFCYFKRMRFLSKNFKKNKYNVVCVRNEIFNGLIALYLRKSHKFIFVYEMENPFEQDYYFRKLYYPNFKLIFYLISKVEKLVKMYILRRADLILPVGNSMENYLIKNGLNEFQMMNIPQGIDIRRFSIDIDSSKIRKRYGLNNSKVFVYVGSLSKSRSLSLIINAFSKVRKSFDVKLLIVGDGSDKENLIKLVDNLKLKKDIIFTGFVDQDDVPLFIHCADYGLSPVPPLKMYKVSIPIKLHEYMAMGKPVIANKEIYEQKTVINDSKGGLLVEFSEKSFADAMVKLLNNPEMARKMGKNAHSWLINNRSYDIIASSFIYKISEMLK